MSDEVEQIKKKKLEALQQHYAQQAMQSNQEEAKLQQQIMQLEAVVKQILTKEALQRYGNLKVAHPEKTVQLLVVIAQLIQHNKITQIDDDQLKEILQQMDGEKRQTKLNYK